jgi:hypothetical protein
MTAVHLQVVFCCALALCAAHFAAKFLTRHFDFNQGPGGPKYKPRELNFNDPAKFGEGFATDPMGY